MSKDSLPSSSTPSGWTLAIPVVLESVFKNLCNEDLFRCRLVCQSWAKEAGRIIGKQLDKKLCTPYELETLREIQMCRDISIPLKTLRLKIPASFNIHQYSRQRYGTVTSLNLGCSPSLVPHLLVNIFPNLESLCLYAPYAFRNNGLVASSAAVWESGTLLRLRNLKLRLSIYNSRSVWVGLMTMLLENAVKLESINLEDIEASAAATLITKVCSSSLRTIKVSTEVINEISENFFAALKHHPITFPLETIDLTSIDIRAVSKLDIKHLLTRFSSTLGKLVLRFNKIIEMNFPLGVPMKNLHTLKIDDFVGSMEWRNLPQMKKLILHYGSLKGIAASISSNPTYCQLESLEIYGTGDEEDNFVLFFGEIAEYLGGQLKVLEMITDYCQSLLPVIFTKLTQLTHLKLLQEDGVHNITNNDLCGGDSFTFTRPRRGTRGCALKNFYKRMIESAKESNHVRGPNLTNLKDLQFLSIHGTFNEVAVLHGIVQCQQLRELNLNYSSSVGMTRNRIVHLLVNAGLEHLTKVKLNGERINHLSFAPMAPRAVTGQRE